MVPPAVARRHRRTRPSLLVLLLLGGCGWRFGPPPVGPLDPGVVVGATVEPSLRAGLVEALARALRHRGVARGGDRLDIEVLEVLHQPEAAHPGPDGATVAWTARLVVRATVEERPGCAVEAEGQRSWFVPDGQPLDAVGARDQALSLLAGLVAERLVDGLAGEVACRTRS